MEKQQAEIYKDPLAALIYDLVRPSPDPFRGDKEGQRRQSATRSLLTHLLPPPPHAIPLAETQELLEWQEKRREGVPTTSPEWRSCMWGKKAWEEMEGGEKAGRGGQRAPQGLRRCPAPCLCAGLPRPLRGGPRVLSSIPNRCWERTRELQRGGPSIPAFRFQPGQPEHALGRPRAPPKPRRRAGTALVSGAGEVVAPDKGPRAKPLLPSQRPARPGPRRCLGGRKEGSLAAAALRLQKAGGGGTGFFF